MKNNSWIGLARGLGLRSLIKGDFKTAARVFEGYNRNNQQPIRLQDIASNNPQLTQQSVLKIYPSAGEEHKGLSLLGFTYELAGREGDARTEYTRTAEAFRRDYVHSDNQYAAARLFEELGDKESAARTLLPLQSVYQSHLDSDTIHLCSPDLFRLGFFHLTNDLRRLGVAA
jgi:hypothetical protein